MKPIPLKGGYRQITDKKTGKARIEPIPGFGLSSSAKIAKRKNADKPKLKRTR
jgi:hypothetical protein